MDEIISNNKILQTFKKNRSEGMRMLFSRYYRPLVLYADEFMHSLILGEDIVQEFFIRLWTDDYLEHLPPHSLTSYLFTSVRNACYTHAHRKDVWNRRIDLSDEINMPVEVALDMDQEIVDRVNKAIAKLPNQTRAVVVRVVLEEKKYQEAADELHISINTLKTLLRNGLRILRTELQDDYRTLFLILCRWGCCKSNL